MHIRRVRQLITSTCVALGLFALTAPVALAGTVNSELPESALNENGDLPTIIGGVINVFLGVLGVIALGYALYGGYLWMTAAGNEEKIEQAKKTLRNGVIGLVIILMSAAIVNFILNRLFEATGVSTGGSGTANCTGCSVPGSTSSDFYVISTNPENEEGDVVLCTDVTVRFSEDIDQTTFTQDNWFVEVQNGSPDGTPCGQNNECASGQCSDSGSCVGDVVSGTIGFGPGDSTKYSNFIPDSDFESNTTYRAFVNGGTDGVLSEDPNPDDGIDEQLAMVDDYAFTFITGEDTDDIPPQVVENASSPFPADQDTDVCTNTLINYDFNEAMRITSFNDDTSFLLDDAPSGAPDWADTRALRGWSFGADFDYVQVRPAEQLSDNSEYGVRLYGGDAANNFDGAITDACGNALDGDADGTSEGDTVDNYIGYDAESGDSEDPLTWTTGETAECTPIIENVTTTASPYYGEYAGARDGEACSDNSECASGTCTAGQCVGYGNTSVQITGNYLGPHPEVEFEGSTIWVGDGFNSCFDPNHFGNIANDTSLGDYCLDDDVQTITEINTRVPVGAGDSNVRVTVADETSEPASQTIEPLSPHITGLSPDDGSAGQYITVAGENFGSTTGTVIMRSLDGARESTLDLPSACGDTWSSDEVVAVAPGEWTNPTDGSTGSWETGDEAYIQIISSDGRYSDAELFTFSETERPNLCSVAPSCDELAGASFTVTGEGFGGSQGDNQVVFTSSSDGVTGYYGSMSSWGDTEASGITDAGMGQDEYWVSVYDAETGENSNARGYDIPCQNGPEVVSLTTCDASSGQYPVPNPRPDETDACINTSIGVLFDQELDTGSVTTASVLVQQYNAGNDLDTSYSPLTVVGNFGSSGGGNGTREWSVVDGDNQYHGFQFDVDATSIDSNQDGIADGTSSALQPNTWYQVTVTDSVTNTSGVGLRDAYTYVFKTRNSSEYCEADSIEVEPRSATVNHYRNDDGSIENELYVANQYDEECSLLDGAGTWAWSLSDTNIGSFGSSTSTNNRERVYAAGEDEENVGTTDVTAQIGDVSDDAQFEVDLAACDSDADCSSCSNEAATSSCNVDTGRCQPLITDFTPTSGDHGTWATINGCMFGSSRGVVYMGEDRVQTNWPDDAQCGDTWTNDQIIIEVPSDADISDGEHTFEVETQYGDSTTSGDAFTVNGEQHPGICVLDPDSGEEEDAVTAYGQNLGGEKGTAIFAGDDDYDGDADTNVSAEEAVTTWAETQVDTQVPERAVTDDEGFFLALSGETDSCTDASSCSNTLGFEVSCNRDSDCGSGCCSDAGFCSSAEACLVCETNSDCLGGTGQSCEGSSCQDGQCSPVITGLAGESGPNGGPVTVQGCYFGSYDAQASAVTFTNESGAQTSASLLCTDGWSNDQIVVEVPDGSNVAEGTIADVTVTTRSGLTTETASQYAVTAECASGASVPADGVPLLCDLDDAYGAAASSDGTVSGDEIDWEGENFVDGDTENLFSDGDESSYDGIVGDAYTFISSVESSAEVANGAQSGNAWVEVQQCASNGLEFTVECTSADECGSGAFCLDGQCTTGSCGCSQGSASEESSQCGESNGCGYNADQADYCCLERPTFLSSNPENGSANACPNLILELEFSEAMHYTSTSDITLNRLNGAGEIEETINTTVGSTGTTLEVTPDTSLDVETDYEVIINSDNDNETGITSSETGLALLGGEESFTFTTGDSNCVPDSVEIEDSTGETSAHTFTSSGSTDNFTSTVYASNGVAIVPTEDVGWNFTWSPYQDDDACQDIAWVQLPGQEIDTSVSDASSDTQVVESGNENDEQTSIEVTVTQTDDSTWQDDRGSVIEDDITVSTFFCEEDLVREYIDSSDDDSFVSHTFPQHFAMRYCQTSGDDLPDLADPVVIEVSEDDGKFLEYLFVDEENQESAMSIWVYSNDDRLTAEQWYQENVPSPSTSVSTVEIDGYAGVQDGTSYYIAASNIDGTSLYPNIYFISFNDDEVSQALETEIMDNWRFNTNISHAECEGSDAEKLRRDTKRITDLNTIAFLANEYYESNGEYPLPESGNLGSYIKGMTTSVWPSWTALGNVFGESLGSDPWNFFDAQGNDEPWINQELDQPWVYDGDDATLAALDCERDEASGVYYDQDGGTCYDDINQSFRCPESSHVYLYKRDENDSDGAALYANLEYDTSETDTYITASATLNPCDGSSECECFNYGIESAPNDSGSQWDEIN